MTAKRFQKEITYKWLNGAAPRNQFRLRAGRPELPVPRNANMNKKMMLFFLLLNVDNDLKTCIMQHEPLPTQRKIARFLQDLRQTVVPNFYVNNSTSAQSFVTECMELYIIS